MTKAHRRIHPPALALTILIVVVACAALVALARLRAPSLDLAITSAQLAGPAFSDGFYAAERSPAGYTYRWTSGSALVQLRGAANLAPTYLLILRLRAENPAGAQPLTFLADGQPLAITLPATRFRVYRLLARPSPDGELRLNLRTPTFVAPGNPRALGVVCTDLLLRPLPQVDWSAALVTAIGLLCLWAVWSYAGIPLGQIGAVIALAGLGLVLLAASYRPAPLPFGLLAAFCLGAAMIVGWLTTRQAPESTHAPLPSGARGWGEGPGAGSLLARLGLTVLALIVSFSGVIWPGWLSDDAFISFRYAQNLVAGHGLVYNVGERVEGYTNFLWTLIAAGVLALGGDVATWSHLSGVALALAIVLLTYALVAHLRGPGWGLLAATLVGTSQSLLLYTARGAGLETGLFTLLTLLGSACYLLARNRPAMLVGAGLLLALSAMTRPEGVLVFALSAAHLLLVRRRAAPLAWLVSAFLLCFGPYYLWRLGYYGEWLPNTFYAKTGGGWRQVLRGLAYAAGFALTLGGPLLLLIAAPWLRDWRAALSSWRGYLLLLALTYSAYVIAVGGDHFRGERFFVPVLPWLAILLADALASIVRPRPQRLLAVVVSVLVTLGGYAALARTGPIDETISGLDESVWIWREIGWWVADHAPPEASLAAQGAGAVAYYSQHPVIDMFGLTEKHIARLSIPSMGAGVAGHEKRDPRYVLQERQPTYIPQIWEGYFGGAAQLSQQYHQITIMTRSGREMGMWERLP